MNRSPLIEFRKVTKQFGKKVVLDRVNLQIFEGEITAIIGLSGAGKTILLMHIIGLLTPDKGEILFQGREVSSMSKKELSSHFARISYMFQHNALFDSLNVYENIALPLKEKSSLSKSQIHQKVVARMEQMELTDSAQKYPSELSGGMQKRTALARALVTDPNIVLFDEPTSGQDPVRKNAILEMILQYKREFGFTAVLVSHEIPDIYCVSNRIIVLYNRTVVFEGTPQKLQTFVHPFQDEILQSQRSLKQELQRTGGPECKNIP